MHILCIYEGTVLLRFLAIHAPIAEKLHFEE